MGCQCPRGSSALAVEKSILSEPRHAAVSEKHCQKPEDRLFSEPPKGSWEPVGPSGIRDCARRRQADVYSQLPGGQKTNSG